MTSRTPSQPPDEPLHISEPSLLSPASPKPIHLPTPSNIPVLELQMDVGFNQTEIHMSDPAMHNTEIRPNAWRDPNEQTEPESAAQVKAGHSLSNSAANGARIPEPSGAKDAGADSSDTTTNPFESQALDHSSQVDINPVNDESVVHAAPAQNISHATDSSLPVVAPVNEANLTSDSWSQEDKPGPAESDAVNVPSLLHTLEQSVAKSSLVDQSVPTSVDAPADSDSRALSIPTQGLGAPPSGLPPRPPPQEQPLIHPNYVHSQHIRDYHPHAAKPALQNHVRSGSQSTVADPSTQPHVPPVHSPTLPSVLSPNAASTAPPTLPTPVARDPTGVHFSNGSAEALIESRRESKIAAGETPSADDRPWDAETQRKYDRFIEEERKYVSEGRWEQFPTGSRLFVGNLSSEKVTKRDIFHIFHRFGDLAQISIKQAYGFVQFFRAEDCTRAMETEQGTEIQEKRIHLEVSKPQKIRNSGHNNSRRSRSPDHARGAKPVADRYVGSGRSQAQRSSRRGSDSYRRSRTPPSRDGYRDRYSDRYHDRSPGGYSRRFRSPSPRRHDDDDLPLPRRATQDVPDVQIIALDGLDRDFISWVEKAFSSRGVRVDVMLLSPRLSEQAVIRRQIVEGVVAVSKLTRRNQDLAKMGLQIFDRSEGANNVKFEEYDNLDPSICAELVLRARHTAAPPAYGSGGGRSAPPFVPPTGGGYAAQYNAPQPSQYGGYAAPTAQTPYGMPAPAYPQQPPPVPIAHTQPNIQNIISSLDPNGLQNLLSAMNQPTPPNVPNYAPHAPAGYPPSSATYGNQQQAAIAAFQQNPQALAGLLQQQQQQQQSHHSLQQQQRPPTGQAQAPSNNIASGQINMQDILSRLGTYKQ